MAREFELKYAADAATMAAVEAEYAGFHVIRMETTYYDNAAGDFRQRHWTLRQRLENGVPVCTIKTGQVNGARGEWEIEAAELTEAIPRLIAMGAPKEAADFTQSGLKAVCGVRFTRKALLLPTGSGAAELALDSGVFLGGGKQAEFLEIEVECKQGTDEDTRRLAEALAERFHLSPQPKSKLARALELVQE